jgi:hypothetical protein
MKRIVKMIGEGVPGSSVDPKFRPVFVGRINVTWFYETLLAHNKHEIKPIPFFESVDEALRFAREARGDE